MFIRNGQSLGTARWNENISLGVLNHDTYYVQAFITYKRGINPVQRKKDLERLIQ